MLRDGREWDAEKAALPVPGRHLRPKQSGSTSGDTIVLSNLRQKESLGRALDSISLVIEGVESGVTAEFLAVDLRLALTHFSHVVGVDLSEEVLNNIFSRFCIGK